MSRGATGLTSTAKRVRLAEGDPGPLENASTTKSGLETDEGIQRWH